MGIPFDAESQRRISDVVRYVEAQGIDRLPDDNKFRGDSSLTWFLLTEGFDATTHRAKAKPGNWTASADSGAGELAADPVAWYYVRDTTGQSSAGEGDWVLCRPIGATDGTVWEVLTTGIGGGIQFAKLAAPLTAGSSCAAKFWIGDPLAEGGDVTVYDWLLGTGESLDSGTKVVITMISGKWYVIAASC